MIEDSGPIGRKCATNNTIQIKTIHCIDIIICGERRRQKNNAREFTLMLSPFILFEKKPTKSRVSYSKAAIFLLCQNLEL